jgi:hypothetical protein
MWISDVYLKMYIEADQPRRIAEARCLNMTARLARWRRLLQAHTRAQHELERVENRDRTRRVPQLFADCP